MTKVFQMQQKVLFKHCDPAGIVFFPRYFEMINDCVETFFDTGLGTPFESFHPDQAVPTAAIDTRFLAPSRHGDLLDFHLATTAVGRTSWTYRMTGTCQAEPRFKTSATLVHVDASGTPKPWPDALRQKLTEYEAQNDP